MSGGKRPDYSRVGGPAQGAPLLHPILPPRPPAGHACAGNSSGVLICFSLPLVLPSWDLLFLSFYTTCVFSVIFLFAQGWVWGGLGGRVGVRWQLSFSTSEPPGRGDAPLSLLLLSRSVVSEPLRPHGLQPTRLLCPWDSPGKSTGAGCHVLVTDPMNEGRCLEGDPGRRSQVSRTFLPSLPAEGEAVSPSPSWGQGAPK